jgi:hypothetical protein
MRGTLFFTMMVWATQATLLLLQQSCNGFAPLFFRFPSQLNYERQQPWKYRLGHLEAATTDINTDASDIASIASISSILATENEKNQTAARYSTQSATFSLDFPSPTKSRRQRTLKFLKKRLLFWKNRVAESSDTTCAPPKPLNFAYDYDVIDLPVGNKAPAKTKTTGIMLIHPIGVGIARWYYQRLVSSLVSRQSRIAERLVIVAPDLLGSGSACNATSGTEVVRKFPLFNISDWTDQLEALMSTVEKSSDGDKIDNWCVITNGGCSPIALQLAQRKMIAEGKNSLGAPVSNLILSSVPRLPFFLKNETTNDPAKVAKSYKTLSGIPGILFWWYACRNQGAFIQTFSEKNLIADPKNLGPAWRSNCFETAVSFEGCGKYATFSFLAGTLQDGCLPSLEAIKDSALEINIIKGADIRRNQAKSWFWQKQKKKKAADETNAKKADEEKPDMEQPSDAEAASATDTGNSGVSTDKPYETFRDYAKKNGNGGREIVIGGRISLAHEDSEGYADAILKFLIDS